MNHIDILTHYLRNPAKVFSILILGERGTGKTKWVKEIAEKFKETMVVANCASFSDDTMAESELFGHKKGSFTGAIEDKPGLFKEAANGILFLDEIHNLSVRVQEKLMTALQTESSGEHRGMFRIRRLGDSKATYVTVRPVFASNLKLQDLKKKLLPDLFDRISQLVVEIPSIHDAKLNVYGEFKKVWEAMQFEKYSTVPHSANLVKWLKTIPLNGNYRTLQSIAINWHQGRLMLGKEKEDEVFDFVKKQFSKFHSSNSVANHIKYNFRKGVSIKELEREYEKALYDWALSDEGYGSVTEAQKGLKTSRLRNPHKVNW